MVMERRLAGTWQRAVNEDTTYQMVFRTDGWAEISVFMNGELFDSTKAQWKVDGSMIVLTFSENTPMPSLSAWKMIPLSSEATHTSVSIPQVHPDQVFSASFLCQIAKHMKHIMI